MYKPSEFAKLLGVSVKTVQRWDSTGKLPAKRTITNHRYYTEQDLLIAKGLQPTEEKKKIVVYCRVSSNPQKPELLNQINAMETYCLASGIAVDEWISEIGGGLNFRRKKFIALMLDMLKGNVEIIIVAHKDRLVRFAFEFIEELAKSVGCKLIIANQESLSPQQELVEDLMAIIHCFSCRLYGRRSYPKETKDKLHQAIDNPPKSLSKLSC